MEVPDLFSENKEEGELLKARNLFENIFFINFALCNLDTPD